VVDLNADRIAAWNANHLPIHETGLPKIVRIARDGTNEATISACGLLPGVEDHHHQEQAPGGFRLPAREPNLFFSTNVTPCIASADVIFICVNTPTKTYGVGAGASADLCALESATRTIAINAKIGAVIVEKSTVPCGTARIISDIVSFPEGGAVVSLPCRHFVSELPFRPLVRCPLLPPALSQCRVLSHRHGTFFSSFFSFFFFSFFFYFFFSSIFLHWAIARKHSQPGIHRCNVSGRSLGTTLSIPK
jgi:hypothetical protein